MGADLGREKSAVFLKFRESPQTPRISPEIPLGPHRKSRHGFQTWQKAGKSHPSARAVLRHATMKLNSEMRTTEYTEYTESQGAGFVMDHIRKIRGTNNIICSFSAYSAVCSLPF
jgi:hypothetical protein